ncbi:MAG: DUF2330 domain-containing protein [Planctomycetota bacterium]|jgi:hypothetical protein
MTARQFGPAVYFVSFLLSASVALGDGTIRVRWSPDADILQPTQKVYIHCSPGQERLVIQTKYEGPAEEMVWLIPVPAQPTVERGDPNLFEELSKETRWHDISHTDFVGLRFYTFGSVRDRDPVEWRERIGDYDVVLLAPVGQEDVIAWLNANEFGVPAEAEPILADYIANGWWMITARIHPDALTEITRDALASGTLHPLDITFPSFECIYPLRLTSLAAGPVEELIYIEGPWHYQPATLTGGDWSIKVFGGTRRTLPDEYAFSAVDQALEIKAGNVTTESDRYLTKLRRVFEPDEMTDDLIFEPMDYTRLLGNEAPHWIAQGATQLGRQRDPAGVPSLVEAISPTALETVQPAPEDYALWLGSSARVLSIEGLDNHTATCWHLRSCIWALGEIAIEHELDPIVETALLRCAGHDNQLIRMEAYTALIKLKSESLGPILTDRFGEVVDVFPTPSDYSLWFIDVRIAIAEMDMVADWIERFGSRQDKDAVVKTLADMIRYLPPGPEITIWELVRVPYDWPAWVVWRAAQTRDAQLLAPLRGFRAGLAPETVDEAFVFLLTAEAACGSAEAATMVAQRMVEDQNKLEIRTSDGHACLPWLTLREEAVTLQQWILWRLRPHSPYNYRAMPPEVCDTIARTALATEGLSDWGTLYLLGHINAPQAADADRLMEVWDRNEGPIRIVAVDLLYVWGDSETLLQLYEQDEDPDVRAEITWVLEEMGIWEPIEPTEPIAVRAARAAAN